MANIIQNMAGMGNMTDEVIANDFLLSAKNGIKNYAQALTEAASPEIRTILKRHLSDAIDTHEKVFNYMVGKGYYKPHNLQDQFKIDMKAADTMMEL